MEGLPYQFRRLRCAAAVAAHGSAARAAEALHQSQPSVTRAIQDLEEETGLPLFERGARGMVPTPAGRLLVARARRAFQQLEQGSQEASHLASLVGSVQQVNDRLARMVNARLLLVLIALAETGSEGRAGERLGLSQPSISQAVRDLEHIAGAQLLQRTSRGVRLTEPGEALLRRAKLALAELRVAEEEVASFQGLVSGRVIIGALPLSSTALVPLAVTRMLALHPELKTTIVDGTYESLMHQLRSAEIDVIVGALREPVMSDIEQEALFDDTLAVASRAGHPLAHRKTLSLGQLVGCPWLIPLPDTPARRVFEEAFRAEGLDLPAVRLQVNSPTVVRSILLGSDYLAFLSPLQWKDAIASGQLAIFPVRLDRTTRSIGLTVRGDGSPSPGMNALFEQLRIVAGELTV
jgi:LysR family transcriptional regulator, regulator for genes of the gallate degradation pathway